MNHKVIRTDIQLLRGLAVSAVLLFHAKIPGFSFGFLGVDMFFVISGYLITGIVVRDLDAGSFSFRRFYLRRAKRLLPAAYVTLVATASAAPMVLDARELADFGQQLASTVVFGANVVLWRQSGYFEGAAELKPLLHMWSLSLEEQYYFLLPAALLVLGARWRRPGVVGAAAISLVAFTAASSSSAGFFLLPTRAWQLLLGSMGALAALSASRAVAAIRPLFWPSVAAVLAISSFGSPDTFPYGINNVLASAGTLVVILREFPVRTGAGPTGAVVKAVRWMGDRSYSLYLVHWPLFAFLNNAWLGPTDSLPPLELRLGLLVLSVVLGALLYRYVERPAYGVPASRERLLFTPLVLGSAALVAVGTGVVGPTTSIDEDDESRKVNYGLDPTCESKSAFSATPACRTSEHPEVLVWGDSYAMHLVPALLAGQTPPRLVQATRSVCGPLLDMAYVEPTGWYDKRWARSCLDFNASVLSYLERTPSVKLVILASSFDQYVSPEKAVLTRGGTTSSEEVRPAEIQQTAAALNRTVASIRTLGREVVVIGPPPFAGYDVGRCLQRESQRLINLGARAGCNLYLSDYEKARPNVIKLIREASSRRTFPVLDLTSLMCSSGMCITKLHGTVLYRDEGHLSISGSQALGVWMKLMSKLPQSDKSPSKQSLPDRSTSLTIIHRGG